MKYHHLTIQERETIQYALWEQKSIREIAQILNRSPSSISRELKRSYPPLVHRYAPRIAHERALTKRKSRGRTDRLKTRLIRSYVIDHLKGGWSPEQIAGRLSHDHSNNSISHEAIYQYIYTQVYRHGHGYVKPNFEDLRPYLKRRHTRRGQRGMRSVWRVSRAKGPSIEERPKIVDQRLRIGDWESDTIASVNHSPGLNSLVDRTSGLVLLTHVSDHTSKATSNVITARLSTVPRHTITFDNGPENQDWRSVQQQTNVQCFFAHPYHSWERGTNENTNGLVRWYFPKGTDFRTIPPEALNWVEYELNTRPRKRLHWKTPLEVFNQGVALEG